jgi:hypothetical protein
VEGKLLVCCRSNKDEGKKHEEMVIKVQYLEGNFYAPASKGKGNLSRNVLYEKWGCFSFVCFYVDRNDLGIFLIFINLV